VQVKVVQRCHGLIAAKETEQEHLLQLLLLLQL
jgi:hypothetical protein